MSGFAQIEKLIMPGPVVESHAEYEDECASCHVRFSRRLQRELCLECHEEVAADLSSQSGFHGLSATIPAQECAKCHTDHEGRGRDIVGLDPEIFDHDGTDFPLLGSHIDAECEDCHESDEPFRAAPMQCLSCHDEDNRHKGNLGESCGDCHDQTRWQDASYDHDQTEFPLTGAHVQESCTACHENEVYVDTPRQCIACHRSDDKHKGGNGEDCSSCHTTNDWTKVNFDHLLVAGFPLTNAHGDLGCEACHEGNIYEQKNSSECFSCHQADDAHEGINGRQCDDCHQPSQWLDTSFDHARDADFALKGAHAENACGDCHEVSVEIARPETSCNGCHRSDEPHEGQLGERCATCHNEVAWANQVRFDHALTRFPLLGQHGDVICEDCHATTAFHDAPEGCVECHSEDDHHDRRLGPDCGRCHNPNDWLLWIFDHNTQTRFVLDGRHRGLDCLACHRTPAIDAIQLAMTCGGCHRSDDVHLGAFGTDCAECHTTRSFEELRELQ